MYRTLFPVFLNNPDLVYFDSAATALKPKLVLDKINEYYIDYSANVERGLYPIADLATNAVSDARGKIAKFVSADFNEIVFTSGATDGMNKVAMGVLGKIAIEDKEFKSRNVVVCVNEHHSSLLPVVAQARKFGFEIKIANEFSEISKLIDSNTCLVFSSLASNVLNVSIDAKEIVRVAHENSALVLFDACQAICHSEVDFKALGADFLVFSGHKMYGPTGIGVLVISNSAYSKIDPTFYGGGAIVDVFCSNDEDIEFELKNGFEAFEPGTLPIAQIIGLAAAVEFINSVSIKSVIEHEKDLSLYLYEKLSKLDFIEFLDDDFKGGHLLSFNVKNIHPHDVAFMLGQKNICLRAGMHCAHLLHKKLGVSSSVRASFGIYNTKNDCDLLVSELQNIYKMFTR